MLFMPMPMGQGWIRQHWPWMTECIQGQWQGVPYRVCGR